ncbi:phosphotransferase [Sporosarcina cyprini]|uniref:phosphotransferase n=1 Tax=Sporosarcina cyprini TaxID=2910523 RepID=UPI001EDE85E4|nr:phosphotransferase [Sporosarcina cyprini]MCG3088972.1 phosphotransferase [Sporosarcina cyprini]
MNSSHLLRCFGFELSEEQDSIYAFSPVYKVDNKIVKRTQYPMESAINLIKYTTYLKDAGIPVVTPVNLQTSNPQQIEEEVYICYPYIDGETYQGERTEIMQAGELLGEIHSLSTKDNAFNLNKYDVFDFTHEEVDEHLKEIAKNAATWNIDFDIQGLRNLLFTAVENQEKLKNASLIWIETPHDFKANNLVFTKKPIVIDPDNAKWIPRIFDLALALLLFHNELSSAPNRLFTPIEWQLFLEGYSGYQTLTWNEKEMWQAGLIHVFLDEVMWLLAEVQEDWIRVEQRELFVSLLNMITNAEEYRLI